MLEHIPFEQWPWFVLATLLLGAAKLFGKAFDQWMAMQVEQHKLLLEEGRANAEERTRALALHLQLAEAVHQFSNAEVQENEWQGIVDGKLSTILQKQEALHDHLAGDRSH